MMQKATLRGVFLLTLFCAMGCHNDKSAPAAASPQSEEARNQSLNWNIQTTVTAYDHAGFTNPKWDDSARECLKEYAHFRANVVDADEPASEIIGTNATAAVAAGCNDPMVRYLYLRYGASETKTPQEIADGLCQLAQEINSSDYPPARKLYAQEAAIDTLYKVYKEGDPKLNCVSDVLNLMPSSLPDALADKTTPPEEIYKMCVAIQNLTSGGEQTHAAIEDIIDKSLAKNWPDSYVTYFLKGDYYVAEAWSARGDGYANTVTKEGWEGFKKGLSAAQEALEHAWKLNPHDPGIAEEMMTVTLGQGDRDRMELWFNRAMQLNTNNYDACSRKFDFLQPKWNGSDEAELEFGRECVQSTNWGGRVPLILVDAHLSINSRNEGEAQANYWKQPRVWADVQAAFDRFFDLNPDAISWYHNYAWYAYHAEQWDKLNELIPKLGAVNYQFFGGKDEYDKMLQLAKEHSHSADGK